MSKPTLEEMLACLERSRLHEAETERLTARALSPDATLEDLRQYGLHHSMLLGQQPSPEMLEPVPADIEAKFQENKHK